MSLPDLSSSNKNHQLNNQGCRCPFCQKVNMTETMSQSVISYVDKQSELYSSTPYKEAYLNLLQELMGWDKYHRKLRFILPEICVFSGGYPVHLITKSKENGSIKLIRSKSKLNLFELQHFFLDGYLLHHPQVLNKKREKSQFKGKMKQLCLIAAKYAKNATALLTLDQLGNIFKSKFKYMRDGLMYMQTLVGAHHAKQHFVKINLEEIEKEHPYQYNRAKLEAGIFVGQIKVTDFEYYPQNVQAQYERVLRRQNFMLYLTYISLKIVFTSSKSKPIIMRECVFKWTCVRNYDFLWDLRVISYGKSDSYWQSAVMQALEVKLKKTMSLMEFNPENEFVGKMSWKADEITKWLEQSTQAEWNEMRVIRARLEKLQRQKKFLSESQKHDHPGNRLFRLRNLQKRQSMVHSVNNEL